MRTSTAGTLALLLTVLAIDAHAQIRVSPAGVNVNGQGATSTFLTFGPLRGYVPAEAFWCGDLISFPTDIGARCDPTTMYGLLPARYDQSRTSGRDAYTDIMSIPPSVARRAYQAAADGRSAEFFYVRRFTSTSGGPDQYVAVTCRLTGGGARVPLSLVDVVLAFDADTLVQQVTTGTAPPASSARITYTGTGRLKGRWEVVLPGQEFPTPLDLLTEATLPLEQRGQQRRYLELERFNVFLPPTGRVTLPGPDPRRLPTANAGQYVLLLRIEASDDRESDSDLAAVGAGLGVVRAGAVAGFPMPVLRYVVGGGDPAAAVAGSGALRPADGAIVRAGDPVDLEWVVIAQAAYYRIEIESGGAIVHQALVAAGATAYRLPPFVADKVIRAELTWRVVAVDATGAEASSGVWRRLRLGSRER